MRAFVVNAARTGLTLRTHFRVPSLTCWSVPLPVGLVRESRFAIKPFQTSAIRSASGIELDLLADLM